MISQARALEGPFRWWKNLWRGTRIASSGAGKAALRCYDQRHCRVLQL